MILESVTIEQRVPSFILADSFLLTALSISLVTVSFVLSLIICGRSFTTEPYWSVMPSEGMVQVVVMIATARALVAATTRDKFGLQTYSFLDVVYM